MIEEQHIDSFTEDNPTAEDKADWIAQKLSEQGAYENLSNSVKADIFGFDISDVSGR